MALFAFTHGYRQRRAGIQNGFYGFCRKQWHIHRGEKHLIALVLQIGKADFYGVKHLGGLIVFVPQENNAVTGKMPFQDGSIVTGDHDDFADPRLAQSCNDPLSHRDGADTQHGLKFSHPCGHTCGNDQCADLHKTSPLKLQEKASCIKIQVLCIYYMRDLASCK